MFSRIFHVIIVTEVSTGNDSAGLHLSSATHPQGCVNKEGYCITLIASNFTKNLKTANENYVSTLLLFFPSLCVVLCLCDVLKK